MNTKSSSLWRPSWPSPLQGAGTRAERSGCDRKTWRRSAGPGVPGSSRLHAHGRDLWRPRIYIQPQSWSIWLIRKQIATKNTFLLIQLGKRDRGCSWKSPGAGRRGTKFSPRPTTDSVWPGRVLVTSRPQFTHSLGEFTSHALGLTDQRSYFTDFGNVLFKKFYV